MCMTPVYWSVCCRSEQAPPCGGISGVGGGVSMFSPVEGPTRIKHSEGSEYVAQVRNSQWVPIPPVNTQLYCTCMYN